MHSAKRGQNRTVTGRLGDDPDLDRVLDAVVAGSRVLVAISTRSLSATAKDVTLAQCRALATLGQLGPQSLVGLASALGVHPSTATRMCDRLIEKGLVRRDPADRGVSLRLTGAGVGLVRKITDARRKELGAIVAQMSTSERRELVRCMETFRRAAGEPGEGEWALGWWD